MTLYQVCSKLLTPDQKWPRPSRPGHIYLNALLSPHFYFANICFHTCINDKSIKIRLLTFVLPVYPLPWLNAPVYIWK